MTPRSDQIPTPELVKRFFRERPYLVLPGPPRHEAQELLEAFERWRRARNEIHRVQARNENKP